MPTDPSRLLRELARADREIADLGALLEIKRTFRTALARRVADNIHLSAVAAASPVPEGPAGSFNHQLPPAEPDDAECFSASLEAALETEAAETGAGPRLRPADIGPDDFTGDVPPTARELMAERFRREANGAHVGEVS